MTEPLPVYRYEAVVIRVVDGDTVDLSVDLGLRVRTTDRFRLYGINAPERWETGVGTAATNHLRELLSTGDTIIVDTHRDAKDKYGRWLATIYVGETNINEQMVLDGHAVFKEY